jgi:polysaccharide biosynthesis transport protein
MSMHQFIEVLKARWRLALALWAGALLLTLIASLATPSQYTATASVLVDMKNADPLSPLLQGGGPGAGYMTTQTDIVVSERVAQRVIQALGLDKSPAYQAQWTDETGAVGDYNAWLAQLLQKKLAVLPTRESGVMWISYTAPDPREAAAVANAYVQAYMATTLDLRIEPARQYSSFFDARAKTLSEALRAAQARLSSYQRDSGILVSDERLDVENARLTDLSTQLVAAQSALADSSSRQQQASVNADGLPEVMNSPLVGSASAELARQQLRLGDLRQRLGDAHPQVREVVASVEQLRAQIDTEMRRASATVGAGNQINQGRVAQLSKLLEEQRARVLRLRGQRDGAAVLLRDVENAQRAYDAIQVRASQTTLESQNTQTNVSVLKMATLPAAASAPKTGANLALAAVLGMLLALAVVMMIELNDRKLRTAQDVVERLRVPLLVTLPRGVAHAKSQRHGARRIKALVLGLRPR